MAPEAAKIEQPILRDRLALDRTKMANERTLLAYVRSAIVLLLAGATLLKLFPKERSMIVIACIVIILGLGAGLVGVAHYVKAARRMKQWGRQLEAVMPHSLPSADKLP